MNKKNYLLERILTLDPVTDVLKAMKFTQILFNMDAVSVKKYESETKTLANIEKDVVNGLNLDFCFELFYTYRNYNFKHTINHKTKSGKIIKMPLLKLRASMRKVYFGIIEIIFTSDIISGDFSIGESGNQEYQKGDEQLDRM